MIKRTKLVSTFCNDGRNRPRELRVSRVIERRRTWGEGGSGSRDPPVGIKDSFIERDLYYGVEPHDPLGKVDGTIGSECRGRVSKASRAIIKERRRSHQSFGQYGPPCVVSLHSPSTLSGV